MVVNEAAQKFVHIDNDGVQVQSFRLENLLAAEGEQLPDQSSRTCGRVLDAFNVISQIQGDRCSAQSQVCVAGDDGEQVVKVVSDSAGKASHCFHLSRLLKLCFQDFALGDVNDDAFHDRMEVVASNDDAGVVQPDFPAIFPFDAEFGLEGLAFLTAPLPPLQQSQDRRDESVQPTVRDTASHSSGV